MRNCARVQRTRVLLDRRRGISSGRSSRGLATITYRQCVWHSSLHELTRFCFRIRSAYRTVWCEPDTVSSWRPLPSDSSRLATRSIRCLDTDRSECSSRWRVSCDDAFPDLSKNVGYVSTIRVISSRLIIVFRIARKKELENQFISIHLASTLLAQLFVYSNIRGNEKISLTSGAWAWKGLAQISLFKSKEIWICLYIIL